MGRLNLSSMYNETMRGFTLGYDDVLALKQKDLGKTSRTSWVIQYPLSTHTSSRSTRNIGFKLLKSILSSLPLHYTLY